MEAGHPYFMLDTQFRCHPDISAFPSAYFYNGKLKDFQGLLGGARSHPIHLHPKFRPLVFHNVPWGRQCGGGHPLPRGASAVDVSDANRSWLDSQLYPSTEMASVFNIDEVEVVISLLKSLARWRGVDRQRSDMRVQFGGTVGIIAFYRAQVSLLHSRIKEVFLLKGEYPIDAQDIRIRLPFTLDVNTVDGFQGSERDAIILTCVRTVLPNPTLLDTIAPTDAPGPVEMAVGSDSSESPRIFSADDACPPPLETYHVGTPSIVDTYSTAVMSRTKGSIIGFVDEPRRMNVALTRAKYVCLVVGCAPALSTSEHWRAFLQHVTARNGMLTVHRPAVSDSW
jgi:superfamily I DNA and/or RNA helicase